MRAKNISTRVRCGGERKHCDHVNVPNQLRQSIFYPPRLRLSFCLRSSLPIWLHPFVSSFFPLRCLSHAFLRIPTAPLPHTLPHFHPHTAANNQTYGCITLVQRSPFSSSACKLRTNSAQPQVLQRGLRSKGNVPMAMFADSKSRKFHKNCLAFIPCPPYSNTHCSNPAHPQQSLMKSASPLYASLMTFLIPALLQNSDERPATSGAGLLFCSTNSGWPGNWPLELEKWNFALPPAPV